MLSANQKILATYEKLAKWDVIIYLAGALGRANHLALALLQASQHEPNKDSIFGTAFLVIWKIVHIYGKRATFKGILSPFLLEVDYYFSMT